MNKSHLGMEILIDNSIAQKYNVADLPLYISHEAIDQLPNKKTVPHWNDGLEIIYIQSGEMDVVVNGICHRVSEHDICVILPGCLHYFVNQDDANCEYYCGVAEETLFTATPSIVDKYIHPLFHSYAPTINIIKAHTDYNERLLRIFRKIVYYATEKPPVYDLNIVSCFHEGLAILNELLHESVITLHGFEAKSCESMRKMMSFIYKNYSKPISTQSLCDAGSLSRNQCFLVFHQYTGDTPANFILKYRLNISRQFLASSSMSIARIAEICGFTHQSHFTNHFSKHFGITPLKFRQLRNGL